MKTLTENQKNFLLETFFKNEKYPGWRSIATKLLESGQCLVAGTHCIWNGGIGNYISTKPAEDAVDCSRYTFHIDLFLESDWFKETKALRVAELTRKKQEAVQQLEEVSTI